MSPLPHLSLSLVGHHQIVLQVNDSIKIFQSKRGRRSATSRDFIYVKVLGFLPSCENLRMDQVSRSVSQSSSMIIASVVFRRILAMGLAIFGINKFL
jgi:hypothetical protein